MHLAVLQFAQRRGSGVVSGGAKMIVHTLAEPDGGASEGAQVVFMLHCAGFHGKAYQKLATVLSATSEQPLRILAPDLRAHGDSARGPSTR